MERGISGTPPSVQGRLASRRAAVDAQYNLDTSLDNERIVRIGHAPRGIRAAENAPDSFGRLLGVGLTVSWTAGFVAGVPLGYLADRWGSLLINAGRSGHINVESGFGPWPDGLNMLRSLQRVQDSFPLGSIDDEPARAEATDRILSRLRRRTRRDHAFDTTESS